MISFWDRIEDIHGDAAAFVYVLFQIMGRLNGPCSISMSIYIYLYVKLAGPGRCFHDQVGWNSSSLCRWSSIQFHRDLD